MEKNPKKSRALIITLIVIIILILVGYFMFRNSDKLFETKSSSTSKVFSSLFGTLKPKGLTPIGNGGDTNTSNGNTTNGNIGDGNTGNNNSTTGSNTSGNTGIGPNLNPLPSPGNNGSMDSNLNGNTGNTSSNPCTDAQGKVIPCSDSTDNPGSPALSPTELCPSDDPLVFTDTEKAELDGLMKKYYFIAPLMKNDEDIKVIADDIFNNQSILEQATSLIRDCKNQKADPSYTGPQSIRDNPYYRDPRSDWSVNYLPGQTSPFLKKIKDTGGLLPNSISEFVHNPVTTYSEFEALFNIW